MNYPLLLLVFTLAVLWISAQIGDSLRTRVRPPDTEQHEDFNGILGANLTLLGLLIGFRFSMAISRYDQRKNLELFDLRHRQPAPATRPDRPAEPRKPGAVVLRLSHGTGNEGRL